MDGIDGIAALEAVTVCVGGMLLCWASLFGRSEWAVPLVLASATLGFLVWNWPSAKIFIGDVGSGFLGLMFGALSLEAGGVAPSLFWGWIILLGVFVTDATVTLIWRVLRREKVFEAHRSHAYQHAAQRCRAHRPVTFAVAMINLGWLLPCALLVARGMIDGPPATVIAYSPLVIVLGWLKMGTPSKAG